ncbi:MAG: aminomethyl-transferring glycine dehydrogenase subunit GcvPA [Candidatus Eisenbacteria bacterium]|uniref:Probable glycine dehydrogenase (decarboxylating) subunit 1 n=1 Tax=Eiseniibacteriota bacterium TaxID=2212470 RepID=A0A849SHX9_UNCEI|nr:aminomethyl-transferring glycine dehydrogenase subunit GcvPA [Candidatus Eisenbacteria bacterium]
MSYVGLTPAEERRMLDAIGVGAFEDLIAAIPAEARRSEPVAIPAAASEIELRRRFGAWAQQNAAAHAVSFLGGGIYDHYIPSALAAVAGRSEFATAYTPYQPEVAQGSLTAIFEFQSMIVELTGCAVANASMYDGATALAEAVLLARHQTGRARVVVAGAVHPNYLAVLNTYLDGHDVTLVAEHGGQCAPDDLQAALGGDVAAVIYQHPNFFGVLENPQALNALARTSGALAIACCDPIALALLEPPGRSPAGADIVVGEGQSLGNPPSFGGPVLGFFACSEALVRRMPGRLAAQTVDSQGRRGFVLTLQTREQHIRREKATSNICTNQGLLALRATIYLGLLGREGLREVAESCVQKTHHAARLAAAIPGYRVVHDGAFFREFVLECPVDARIVIREALTTGVLPGVDLAQFRPEWKRMLLVAVTEQRSAVEIDAWAAALRRAGGAR